MSRGVRKLTFLIYIIKYIYISKIISVFYPFLPFSASFLPLIDSNMLLIKSSIQASDFMVNVTTDGGYHGPKRDYENRSFPYSK